MQLLHYKTDYKIQKWFTCGDFKVIGILLGLQSGHMKYCSFLCTRESRAPYQHYNDEFWPVRETLEPGKMKVAQKSLMVDPKKIFSPELHMKLGIVKNFIETLNKNGEAGLFILKNNFFKLSEATIREGVFNALHIQQLILDCNFKKSLTELKRRTWLSVKAVINNSLANTKSKTTSTWSTTCCKTFRKWKWTCHLKFKWCILT